MPEIHFEELKSWMVTPTNVAEIDFLLRQLSPTAQPCGLERLKYILDTHARLFVAKENEMIIGTVLLVPMRGLVGQKDWIEDVVVDRAYLRRGIARQLMDMAEQASRQGNATSIHLTSGRHRKAARAMYSNRGYELLETDVFRLTL